MALVVRTLHVASATFAVGIPVALALVITARPAADVIERLVTPAERWLWASLGVLVATGVGNLAVFEGDVAGGEWPAVLFSELGFVLVLLIVSAVRTFVIANLAMGTEVHARRLGTWYGATAMLGLAIVVLAEVLAHG